MFFPVQFLQEVILYNLSSLKIHFSVRWIVLFYFIILFSIDYFLVQSFISKFLIYLKFNQIVILSFKSVNFNKLIIKGCWKVWNFLKALGSRADYFGYYEGRSNYIQTMNFSSFPKCRYPYRGHQILLLLHPSHRPSQ